MRGRAGGVGREGGTQQVREPVWRGAGAHAGGASVAQCPGSAGSGTPHWPSRSSCELSLSSRRRLESGGGVFRGRESKPPLFRRCGVSPVRVGGASWWFGGGAVSAFEGKGWAGGKGREV